MPGPTELEQLKEFIALFKTLKVIAHFSKTPDVTSGCRREIELGFSFEINFSFSMMATVSGEVSNAPLLYLRTLYDSVPT